MNKKTTCINDEQFNRIIGIMYNGESYIKPNKEMALVLTITGNCGLRIGDCLSLTLGSFIREGNEYHFNIIEEKTGKKRTNVVPKEIYSTIKTYAEDNERTNTLIFDYGIRSVQLKLREVCNYLGDEYKDVSTHSFRKRAGMNLYKLSGNDIELVRKFYNHSSVVITQRYLGIEQEDIDKLLMSNYSIPFKTA